MVTLAGLTTIDVSGGVTVKKIVVVSLMVPEVPVTTIECVPVAVDDPTVIVMIEVPAALIVAGLKLTVNPVGRPDADRLIGELKPPVAVLVMVKVPELPCTTMDEVGDAERKKPGDGLPASALISPDPFGLPQPVAKS